MNSVYKDPRPIPASTDSRSKLDAFRFKNSNENGAGVTATKTSPQKGHTNKENQTSWLNGVVKQDEPKTNNQQPLQEATEAKALKDGPQTPGNRLPLADLIGNAEDAFSRAPVGQEFTPEEYVVWQHGPPSSNPSTQTPATQSKKRRHSSSPSSSPLASSKRAQKGSFDLKSIQTLLKTPQNDLAADLWNNYVAKTTTNVPDLQQPRFANLLSSSPHTPGSARTGDSSGLRRSISCNAEWPSSNAKRRKVEGESHRKGRAIFSRSRSNVMVPKDLKASNFSSLVQEMERSLKRDTPGQPDPCKPAPVTVPKKTRLSRSASPLETKFVKPRPKDIGLDGNKRNISDSPTDEKAPQESSSDFGGDDIDDELLGLAEASMDPFVEPAQGPSTSVLSTNYGHAFSSNKVQQTFENMGNAMRPETHEQLSARDAGALNIDEFDDGFDEFSDNINDLLAGCDQTPSHKLPRAIQQHPIASNYPATHQRSQRLPAYARESQNEQLNMSSDEFDDDDFDMSCLDDPIPQGEHHPDDNYSSRKAIKRYLIVDIAESTYACQRGRIQPEKVLSVQDEMTKLKKVIVLRDSWFDSPCDKDFYIHLIGEFDVNGHCIVTDAQNMIVIHPDHLISATVIADSVSCQRRAVLQERIKRTSDLGKPQVFGNIFHEIFQEAMKLNQWDTASLRALSEDVAIKHVEELYLIHMSVNEAVDHVMSRIPGIQRWAELFLRPTPGPQSFVEDRNSSKMKLSVNKLLEVEEHVWSPMYGLKGNIDATVQVACNDGEGDKNLIVPLELKTGNKETNQAHRAQTALYTLLLSDRYDVEVTFGLLYYLETSKIMRIRGIRHELLHMIQERNRVAGYVRQRTHLPPMIKRPSMCGRCYSKTACFIYHKLADDGNGETSGLGEEFEKAMEHLNPSHRDFFRKWDGLLTKEETSMMRFKRELWTLLSHEREALGRCFGNVVIEPQTSSEDKGGTKINRYRYTFIKKQQSPPFSFTESQITIGEPIVISDEKGHFALANGYVVQISPRRVTVAVDRRLHNARTRSSGFDAKMNQSFKGLMEIDGVAPSTAAAIEPEEEVLYRLDKDEFSNGMAIVRSNIIAMMEKDLFQAGVLRQLIVEGRPPKFKTEVPELPGLSKAGLNIDQKKAISKVMSAQDYALVLGMPGTGKTTTIAHILRTLVAQGKSVLLTSYTHTAVDNILLKVRDDNMRILRIGAAVKVHPDIQEFADLAASPKKTIEELKAAYEDSQVVATTCLGVGHNIFNQRIFDYCIVDEASQITLPVCLGPIRMAKTFILVGDHYQLPPLVQNKEAQAGGLDVSLFKLLSDTHPSSVVNLEHQYRMCEDVMLLSNTLIYSGRLKCGTSEVASRSLEIPSAGGLKQFHLNDFSQASKSRQLCLGTGQGRCWLRDLVDPSAKTCLVNTDTLGTPARDVTNGSRIVNPTEATLCTQLVEAFISCGIPARSIGVITFYRSQLSLLKQNLRHHLPALEMHTADKFQGRDKEIIILSCVRSNQENYVGDLLSDWRRVNVAFTRARTKLLVLGSKNTLRNGNELLGEYVKLVEQRGWVYDLPKNAVENHIFDDVPLSTYDRFTPSPQNKSPVKDKTSPSRNPLSPTQGRNSPNGLRKPAKKGMNLLSGQKVLGNRPVLQDVVNDIVG